MKLKTLKDIKGKKVTIFGLGLHGGGVGAAEFFARFGAKVLVTDIKKEEDLKPSLEKLKAYNIEYVLGKHLPENFIDTDIVIKNPAISKTSPYLKLAKDHGVLVESDITIFFRFCPSFIIGITGTKGKSTTAALTAELLKSKGAVALAGNIGKSVLSILPQLKSDTLVVLELSSFQLEDLAIIKKSPNLAVITNIFNDHLNKYGTLENYIAAKKNIFKYQKKDDFLVLPFDYKNVFSLASEAKSKVFLFSSKFDLSEVISKESIYQPGAYLSDGSIFLGHNKNFISKLEELKIFGHHNVENLLCAATTAFILGANLKNLPFYLKNFKWLQYRLTLEKESNGISFFNDSCATNPTATMRSSKTIIEKFGKTKVALILGGEDKKLDFAELIDYLIENFSGALIMIPGSGSDKMTNLIEMKNNKNFIFNKANDLEDAVKKAVAYLNSIKGGALLFSPACASFNAYKNEYERGEHFSKIISYY